ncbi:MAG: DNA alkylation repair protein [Verrucomicrobiales bacterium]|nr:DNA alkylation repair protein [Verrucomicrobiales bacterium]MCP5560829.1 DNA alkylation repair protein [Verrucomicrobiaceae bacterium]
MADQGALTTLRESLRDIADPIRAKSSQRFFKTDAGQYGEGDVFLGISVPEVRSFVRDTDVLNEAEVLTLVRSDFHEERMLGLYALVRRFERGDASTRQHVFDLYLANTRWINNWDLVDTTAPNIVGEWLLDHDRAILCRLAASKVLWERRIAVLATLTFIRRRQFSDTLQLVTRLLHDPHDLMHKACGWMLREIGKRDLAGLRSFLARHAAQMPRTMLRYAIERLGAEERNAWLQRRS